MDLRTVSDKLESLFLHPFYGGVTAVLTVMTGSLASFFTEDIKASLIPFFLIRNGQFSGTATSFWICLVLVGISLSGTQWAQSRSSGRARKELGLRADELRKAISRIESLPPEGFLAEFQKLIGSATRSTIAGVAARGEMLDKAVRNVLGSILELAKKYDKKADACYCANVMIYRSHGWKVARQDDCVTFKDGVESHPDYDGFLELIISLSTTTSEPDFGPDPEVPHLVLPISAVIDPILNTRGSGKHPVLPGAPWSYVYQQFSGFVSIERLFDWLDNRCSGDAHMVQEAMSYFRSGKGKHIKSFASMPIIRPSASVVDTATQCIGVINIHSSEEGLLQEKGGERFAPLCEPFLILLSILLSSNRFIDDSKAGGSSVEPVSA
jgi:hypothetical protein